MMEYAVLADYELVSLFKEGDTIAYSELYARYWHLMYIYACKMLDKDEAEDIIQEVFTSLWTKKADLTIKSSVSNYLYSAVRFKIFDHFDYKKVRSNYIDSLQDFIDKGDFITDKLIREKELSKLVEAEIQRLPCRMREVFELSRKAYLSQKEIAERLNISDKTVKKQMNNALKILKLRLTSLFSFLLLFFPGI